MKKQVLALMAAVFLSASPVFAMEEEGKTSGLSKISVNDHHIYTTHVKLSSQKSIYFGCEPIPDEERSKKWSTYAASTFYQCDRILPFTLQLATKGQLTLSTDKGFYGKGSSNPEEWINLINEVNRSEKTKDMKRTIEGISSGCLGMHTSKGDYVTYISKKPITDFFPLPDGKPSQEQYPDAYDDLIMTVSSFPHEIEGVYEHRGIFRSLNSMLRKDYPNLGLMIHGFTACVWAEQFPKIRFMTVNPEGNVLMKTILFEAFNTGEMRVYDSWCGNTNETKKYEYELKFTPTDQTPTLETSEKPGEVLIKIEALKNKFFK